MSTAIFFDLDGTILTYDRSFPEIFETVCERMDVPYDREIEAYYTERFFENFRDFRPNPFVTAAREAVYEFDLDVDGKELGEARIDAEIEALQVPDGVRPALEDLSDRYVLGVLTNGVAPVQKRKLELHDLDDLFDAVLVSEEIGALKPDPDIFEAARRAVPAVDYVYVGDSIEDDLPAGECDFQTVIVAEEDVPEADLTVSDPSGIARIESDLLAS